MTGIDTVFYHTALIAIPYSFHASDSHVDTNIKGTLNVCQAAWELGGIRVINFLRMHYDPPGMGADEPFADVCSYPIRKYGKC